MSELKNTASAPPSHAGTRDGAGFELRLERGAVHVRLEGQPIAPGVRLELLTLQIPDVKFPFDVGQGVGQFRHRLSDLVELSVTLEAAAVEAALARANLAASGLENVRVALREGFAEIAGRLAGGPAFTLEAGLLPAGDQRVGIVLHAPRVFGHAPIPAAALPHVARAVLAALGPEELRTAPLPVLLRRVLAPRGWKLPRAGDARLARAVVSGGAARLTWDRAAPDAAQGSTDPDLLAADEGARTFAEAEALLAKGDHAAAREAYLAAGPAATTHPFGAERLLSLLSHDEHFHEEALDLAAEWQNRRPWFEPALLAEATIRAARGEAARAVVALCTLSKGAAARGRAFLALAAADAALELQGAPHEERLRAVDVALGLRRDHLGALRVLRDVARARGDREGLLRASRRLVAYEPDPAAKARAHADLGQLLLQADPAGARLHLDQALRLGPDDVTAQAALAKACASAGEPLRAVRALDRVRELLVARGDRTGAAQAALDAGALWEGPLGHAENALLRYRDAAELAPSADATARAARAAEAAGHWQEAADLHASTLAALDPASPGATELAFRTRLALAEVADRRLGDPAGAAAHLEYAAALAPADAALLRRLVDLERSLGRRAELLRALDRLAPLETDATARATLLADAGEAALALGLAGDARARFTAAIAQDPRCRPALLGAAHLAASRGDAPAERDALEKLLPLAAPGAEAADVLDRLASARDRAGDLAGAAVAAAAARAAVPTPARLDVCVALARRAGDPGALAALLVDRARASAAAGDALAATEAWLERARLVAASPAEALAALAEARAISPGDPAVLRAQADLAERTGDARLALGCLRALLASGPEDGSALDLRAARAAIAIGEITAAKEHAERALALDVPGAAEVLDEILARAGDDGARAEVLARLGRHLEAARLLERHGDPAGARAALERAAADPATAARALPRLAELRLDAGDRTGAAAALLELARLSDGREAARLALQAWATGRDAAALDLAIARDPRFAPPFARRAALRAAVDPRAALADAEAALAAEGLAGDERPELLALAARTAAAVGDGEAARRHLAAYCDAAPDDDAALARLAALHRAAGARDALAGVLARRLGSARGPDALRVRLELSDLLTEAEPGRAARLALDALTHDPTSVEALRALTSPPRAAHVAPPERAALLDRLARAAATSPAEAAAAHGARALLLAGSGDAAGALAAVREAARAAGEESDELLELRARLQEERGDAADAARALLERARRAEARGEPHAAERLADAGLRAMAAGLDGGEAALEAALARGPERETARAALEALTGAARARGDDAAERQLLPRLVPLLPTGARPAALLRLSALALEAKDVAVARASADEARTLAPRELAAVEASRAAALAAGDVEAVADRLADAAALDPAGAGPRLLERARLLAALGRAPDADAAFSAALAALPPERALADEHARLRREALPARPAAAPIEAFALRCPDRAEAASALRAAAALALAAADAGAALRCARGAWARTEADPGFAGPLLARVLYLLGSVEEALGVHRRLLDAGVTTVAADDAVAICRQAADLAEAAGERDLARRALDELLRLRPQEVEAALARFELDPDRPRAVRALVEAAGACRSRRRRVLALAVAAGAAMTDLRDFAEGDALFTRARADAEPSASLAQAVARRRAAAIRASQGASSEAHLEALHAAATAAEAAADRGAARDLLEDAVALQRELGLFAEAAHDLLQLDALAAAEGDFAESAGRLRAAAALLREAGDLAGATEALRIAWAANPDSEETARRLEEALREAGPSAADELAELLNDRAARAPAGPGKAAALVLLAAARRDAGDSRGEEDAVRAALAEVPGHPAAETRLLALLEETHRDGERARLLLERSARLKDEGARLATRREAARALAASAASEDRDLAAEAWRTLAAADPHDLEAARAAAGLLIGLGRREDAVPHLETLVRADPGDDAAAGELSIAYADRPAQRAELFLARAERAEGERRAEHLREAAGALFASADPDRARATLREAFEAWPADAAAFEEAVRDATGDVDRLDAVLARRARAVPAEAASCQRARGDALRSAGRVEDAIAAYEAARAAAPDDVGTMAGLAASLAESRGDAAAAALDRALVVRAEESPGDVPAEAEAQARFRLGLALSFAGGAAEAVPHLERALSLAPHDAHAGLGWAAVAEGYADRGDGASALAAARARIERAVALGLETERAAGVEAEAALTERFGLPSALGPAELEVPGAPAPARAEVAAAGPSAPVADAPAAAPPAAIGPDATTAETPLAGIRPAEQPLAARSFLATGEGEGEQGGTPGAPAAPSQRPHREDRGDARASGAAVPPPSPEAPNPFLVPGEESAPASAPKGEPVRFRWNAQEPAPERPVAFAPPGDQAAVEEPIAFAWPEQDAAAEEPIAFGWPAGEPAAAQVSASTLVAEEAARESTAPGVAAEEGVEEEPIAFEPAAPQEASAGASPAPVAEESADQETFAFAPPAAPEAASAASVAVPAPPAEESDEEEAIAFAPPPAQEAAADASVAVPAPPAEEGDEEEAIAFAPPPAQEAGADASVGVPAPPAEESADQEAFAFAPSPALATPAEASIAVPAPAPEERADEEAFAFAPPPALATPAEASIAVPAPAPEERADEEAFAFAPPDAQEPAAEASAAAPAPASDDSAEEEAITFAPADAQQTAAEAPAAAPVPAERSTSDEPAVFTASPDGSASAEAVAPAAPADERAVHESAAVEPAAVRPPVVEPVAGQGGVEEPAGIAPPAEPPATVEPSVVEPSAVAPAPEESAAVEPPAPARPAEAPAAEPPADVSAVDAFFALDEPPEAVHEVDAFEPPPEAAASGEVEAPVVFEAGTGAHTAEDVGAGAEAHAEEVVEGGAETHAEEDVGAGAEARAEVEAHAEEVVEAPPAEDTAARIAGWIASAIALARSGGARHDVEAALDRACEIDPDAAHPWRERARLEEEIGDAVSAARSYLAVWLRAEGPDAADAALAAARLFEAEGHHADAARSYRGALHASPGIVPPEYVVASEALAAGDAVTAARHLAAVEPRSVPDLLRGLHARKLAFAVATAGDLEAARDTLAEAVSRDPGDAATARALAVLDARTDDWAAAAAAQAERAAQAADAGEAAARYVHAARLLHERAADKAGAIAALRAALGRARHADTLAGRDAARDAEALLHELGAPLPVLTPAPLAGAALSTVSTAETPRGAASAPSASAPSASALSASASAPAPASGPEPEPEPEPEPASASAPPASEPSASEPSASEPAPVAAPAEDLQEPETGKIAFEALDAAALPDGVELVSDADILDAEVAHAFDALASGTGSGVPGVSPASTPAAEPPLGGGAQPAPVLATSPAQVGAEPAAQVAAEPAPAPAAEPAPAPVAEPPPAPAGPTPEPALDAPAAAREGRALMEQGDWEGARAKLRLALANEPSDLTLARDVSRVAEKLRRWDEYVELGEVCADAISAYDPLAAAARYRHFALVLRDRLSASDRAAAMLQKALALVPDDLDTRRELVAIWSDRPETQPRALAACLDLARKDPTDAAALAGVARVAGRLASTAPDAEAGALRERAQLATALAAFAAPGHHLPPLPPHPAAHIPPEIRARLAAPGAGGPLARVVELLAPWLEALFPADLKRRGARPEDLLDHDHAPALSAALDAAAAALGARPVSRYLVDRPSLEPALENTRPPAVIFSTAAARLDEPALAFLAARTFDLVSHGSTLLAKFAPRDVAILLELACRFAGGRPPSLGLPEQRAGAFLGVLEQAVAVDVREAVRPLGAAAAEELAGTDPRNVVAALRRTANRVGLLYGGDPATALRTLALLDRRLDAGQLDPVQALALPDLRDLAVFALSDTFLELRAAGVS